MSFANNRFIDACFCRNTDRPPAWLMRQAGRYLPEYRTLRQSIPGDFLDFCKQPEAAFQATMMPLQRYKLDASILFSDILVIPDASGLEIGWRMDPLSLSLFHTQTTSSESKQTRSDTTRFCFQNSTLN